MIALIANPDAFKGRRVRAVGYVELGADKNVLYVNEADYKAQITKNGLALKLTMVTDASSQKKYNKNYVLLEGTFDPNEGDLGLCSGSLLDVDRMAVWKGYK